MNKENKILLLLKANLAKIKIKYPIQNIAVFGSYSRGDEKPNSDLDILYETLPNTYLNLHNYLSLQKELGELTKLKIDLVNKKNMNDIVWLSAQRDIQYV